MELFEDSSGVIEGFQWLSLNNTDHFAKNHVNWPDSFWVGIINLKYTKVYLYFY